eukprot:TRINITY_DN1521_c0_g1_i1.p1 TRINITY_DN1521_c0_g1~~TRINITY_DN1521_c0_g1_i1.p1  ORF type:complete len:226 (+),score=30.14 TRINITY_DN1521_c0_g1_i1:34-678(+)
MERVFAQMGFFVVGVLVVCGVLLPVVPTVAFTFDVHPHQEECFFEDVQLNAVLSMEFQVIKGGFLDIDVHVFAPSMLLIYQRDRETEGQFSTHAQEAGEYRFCFSNRMSTLTPKVVSLVTDVKNPDVEQNKPSLKEHLSPLDAALNQLQAGVEHVKSEQSAMRLREEAHRNTSESTNTRVLWWSIFEAVCLVVISVWQVWSIRKFFEVKRHGSV